MGQKTKTRNKNDNKMLLIAPFTCLKYKDRSIVAHKKRLSCLNAFALSTNAANLTLLSNECLNYYELFPSQTSHIVSEVPECTEKNRGLDSAI